MSRRGVGAPGGARAAAAAAAHRGAAGRGVAHQLLLLLHQVVTATQVPPALATQGLLDGRDAEADHVGLRVQVPAALPTVAAGDDALVLVLSEIVPLMLQVVVVVPCRGMVLSPPGPEGHVRLLGRVVAVHGDGPLLRVLRKGSGHDVAAAVARPAGLGVVLRDLGLHVEYPPNEILRLRRRHRRTIRLPHGVADRRGALPEHRGFQRLQLAVRPQVDRLAIHRGLPGARGAGARETREEGLGVAGLAAEDGLLVVDVPLAAQEVPVRVHGGVSVPSTNAAELGRVATIAAVHPGQSASGRVGSNPSVAATLPAPP
mmetsp:Transcript_95320/g.246843  ORF Transcript_95320/g.246843 Transcript_95320/m.246843 type:complete len:316 (+) Transcript_95320:331-1278(+)